MRKIVALIILVSFVISVMPTFLVEAQAKSVFQCASDAISKTLVTSGGGKGKGKSVFTVLADDIRSFDITPIKNMPCKLNPPKEINAFQQATGWIAQSDPQVRSLSLRGNDAELARRRGMTR